MDINDITVYTHLSPRVIEVHIPITDVTVQDIVNTLRDWEDDNLSFDSIVDAAGKEALGGGVAVGITATLQNAQIMFEPRTTPLETGICTTSDSTGTALYASGGGFVTNGVYVGCIVFNVTTASMAVVSEVVSDIELRSFLLSGGSSAQWTIGDAYAVYPNVQCSIGGGNLVAVDSLGVEMDPIMQSPNVQVVRSNSSSATILDLSSMPADVAAEVWSDIEQYSPRTKGWFMQLVAQGRIGGYPDLL